MREVAPRYSAVAVALHWAIAAAITGNTLLGWWMHRAIQAQGSRGSAIAAFQIHKSIGLTILALSLLHVAAALKHRFTDADDVLGRMLPVLWSRDDAYLRPNTRLRRTILIGGFAAIAIAALAVTLVRASRGGDAALTQGTQATISSTAGGWVIDPRYSEIAFSGIHAGVPFRGRFTRWQADLRLDSADLTRSHIAATIETASASDGVPLHDASLPQAEWFDTADHPLATFRATRIRQGGDHRYVIDGTLTIKGRDIAVSPLALQVE